MNKTIVLALFLYCLFPFAVYAEPSRLFLQETPQLDKNEHICVGFCGANYSGQKEFSWPKWRVDYKLNPLAEARITPEDAGLKMIVGDNLAFYGLIKYAIFRGKTGDKDTLTMGFAYMFKLHNLSINFNPYFEGTRSGLAQANLGAIYEINHKVKLLGEYVYNHDVDNSYYTAALAGLRFIPIKALSIDLGFYYQIRKIAVNTESTANELKMPVFMRASFCL